MRVTLILYVLMAAIHIYTYAEMILRCKRFKISGLNEPVTTLEMYISLLVWLFLMFILFIEYALENPVI